MRELFRAPTIVGAIVLLLADVAPLLALPAAPTPRPGLSDPAAAKLAVACSKAITRAANGFVTKKQTLLKKCTDVVTACVQIKQADMAPCLARATATCDKQFAKIGKAEAKLVTTIPERCARLASDALFAGVGLGYGQASFAASCAEVGVGDLFDVADVASCIAKFHECRVEQLLSVQDPLAGYALGLVGRPLTSAFCPQPTPVLTPTPTPSASGTATPIPTATDTPTETPTLTAIPTPTETATPELATLSVSGSPLTLHPNGAAGSLTITNTSVGTTATNIASALTGTALAGTVTETGNTCASVAPSNSCTLTFTPGATPVAETSFVIQGTNTTSTNGAIAIVAWAIGDAHDGGTVACLGGGLADLVAATADNSTGVEWGGFGTTVSAQSETDGATNTATIVATLGAGTGYAAGLCDAYEVDSAGNAPCQTGTCFGDWYLPAKDQLSCLYQNAIAIGGFAADVYWTSTELAANPSFNGWAQDFSNGQQFAIGKNVTLRVRCVRTFVP